MPWRSRRWTPSSGASTRRAARGRLSRATRRAAHARPEWPTAGRRSVWNSYLSRLAPETILVIVAVAVCMGGVFGSPKILWRWIALLGLAAAAVALAVIPDAGAAWPTIRADAMASFGRALAIAAGFL